ncbi:class II fructose-bisphosphate aldolase [Companilactobacillus zhachilii]|uniref:Class II fructose-bisphosphate aldolase n=1 Tax=Companilactobacillus zhachilii TaxID=2304606 RepID=A0A386PS59_9LACO|nr:class II fructose-bisphosphate aldolase [Companilactobacillus zhachilii]AYE37200.1 class II fructose-bisphosphate aldolase [Companilactobacillus zhachilii]
MYVSMKKMLNKANYGNYAIMAINCFNLESAYATITAAEELHAPIIIDLLMEHLQKHIPKEYVLPPVIKMAKDASVDVAINLDHGKSESYVRDSILDGFSSVMMDASEHSFEENIQITNEIVKLASKFNTSVEAEIGNMGAVAGDHFTQADMYTDPEKAIEFMERTDVTALAISFGSSHGIMPKDFVPVFDFNIIKKIKAGTHKPLVLHGGSGCGKDNIQKAIKCGINKVNVGSDVMKAQADSIFRSQQGNRDMEYVDLMNKTLDPAKEVVKYYIELSGSTNKAE